MAKFPPDDDDLPAGPAPTAGGGRVAEDGNFKRGRMSPIVILLVLVTLIGGGAALYFAFKQDQARLLPEQIAKEKQDIFLLPATDQVPRWREWAVSKEADMVNEALAQLAWLEDAEGPKLAAAALGRENHQINGVAAQVLAHYGSPRADEGKAPLLAALAKADDSDRPQIVWALVVLGESSVFPTAMDLYRKGHLSKVQRLGGGAAFDPQLLPKLVSLDELAKLVDDPSSSVRQLLATVLSNNAEAKWTDTLIKLVNDADIEVAREAANGLGRIGDEKAREPLLKKLMGADADSRKKFLEALRDGIGGEGLVLALQTVVKEPEERNWFQYKQIFEMLKQVQDPRIGPSLSKWAAETEVHPHWKGEAGLRLAEVGDIRAVPLLAERLKLDPLKLYKAEKFWEADEGGHMSRTDNPRVVAARMLADLAILHPDKRDELLVAEGPVIAWLVDKPQPHANGVRFLANIKSDEARDRMRKWAFPDDALPKEGAQPPFPTAFETAQSALRYVGRMKDEPSYPKLLDQLKRKKDAKMDITQAGLEGAGLAMMGMALRAVAYGASQGLGEWGDAKAVKPMMEFIEDETWHEEARLAACEALAWCATPDDMKEIAKRAVKFAKETQERKQLIGACYATTLSLKPVPEVKSELVDLLTQDLAFGLRNAVAQAIGASPLDDASRDKLFEKMKDIELRNPAALALILGGDRSTAARTVAMFGEHGKDALGDLKDAYFRAFGFWSDEDFTGGNIYRWVDNAEAIARVKVFDAPQEWAIQRLSSQFDNLQYDNGPHSETRVVLRYRLYQAAKTGDDATRAAAMRTLKFMKERGVLMALRDEKGPVGELAKKVYHELVNPKPIVAESLETLQKEQAAKKSSN